MSNPFAHRQPPSASRHEKNLEGSVEFIFKCSTCGEDAGRDPNGVLCHISDHVTISGGMATLHKADHSPTIDYIDTTGREV